MTQPAQHSVFAWSFGAGLAMLLHGSVALLWLPGPEAPPPRRPPIKVQLAKLPEPPPEPPPPEPPPPEPPPPEPPPPEPLPEPKAEPPPAPKPKPKPRRKPKPAKATPEPAPAPKPLIEPPPLIETAKPIVTKRPTPTPVPRKAPKPPPAKPRLDSKARGKLLAGYGRGVLKSVRALKHYPASAVRLGLEGLAKIELHIDRRGRLVAKPRLVRSTGHRILDEEALKTAAKAAPYPPLPQGFDRPTAKIVMPFKFSLPKRG